jgi:hypothetical protein
MTKFSGSDWIISSKKYQYPDFKMSSLGKDVADLLGQMYQGIYHIDKEALKVDWSNEHWIEIVVSHHAMATWDYNRLTAFVILCHDRCLRGSIEVANFGLLRLVFHRRDRDSKDNMRRHPAMEEAIKMIRIALEE